MAIFLILQNDTTIDDKLMGVSSPIAEKADMRTHITKAGVMSMPRISNVPVAARSSVSLEPGGRHIMLFDVKMSPKPGSHFPLTLTFAHAKPQTVCVLAKSPVANAEAEFGDIEHMHH